VIDQRYDVSHHDLLPQWGSEKMRNFRKRPAYVNRIEPGSEHEWGWFKTFILNFQDGTSERCIGIKLPIWGYAYSLNDDDIHWAQLTFQYRGQRGCFLAPWFAPPDNF
jgi:hypothetical protein